MRTQLLYPLQCLLALVGCENEVDQREVGEVITYRQAKKLLPVGDVVFVVTEDGGEEAVVEKVLQTCLKTDKGYLDYDLHGDLWFLTEKGCVRSRG